MPSPSSFRFDGVFNVPTLIAIGAAVCAAASGLAVAQSATQDQARRLTTLEEKYERIPERLATIEANSKNTNEAVSRIETKIDRMAKDF